LFTIEAAGVELIPTGETVTNGFAPMIDHCGPKLMARLKAIQWTLVPVVLLEEAAPGAIWV
jgi:hypothetical protein